MCYACEMRHGAVHTGQVRLCHPISHTLLAQAFLSGATDFVDAVNRKEGRDASARAGALTQEEIIAQALASTRSEVEAKLAAADSAAAEEVRKVAAEQQARADAERKRLADADAARAARARAENDAVAAALSAKQAQRAKEAKVRCCCCRRRFVRADERGGRP